MHEEYEATILRLMAQSRTDDLTGLGNFRAFREYCDSLVDLGVGFAVVLFDMTNLKQANLELGHFAADVLLRNIAALLRKGVDHVFRYGGDEFAIVLPCSNEAGGIAVRDRVEKLVGVSWLSCGAVFRIVGAVACYTPDKALYTELQRADRRLENRKAMAKA